jgi:hypothetical protein
LFDDVLVVHQQCGCVNARPDVFQFQRWILAQDFLGIFTSAQKLQYRLYCYALSPNRWPAVANLRINGNPIGPVCGNSHNRDFSMSAGGKQFGDRSTCFRKLAAGATDEFSADDEDSLSRFPAGNYADCAGAFHRASTDAHAVFLAEAQTLGRCKTDAESREVFDVNFPGVVVGWSVPAEPAIGRQDPTLRRRVNPASPPPVAW